MKKLKKIKIIEDGRICSPEEMNSIRGGYEACTGGVYASCTEEKFTMCALVPSFDGYENNGDITCSIGYVYANCTDNTNLNGCSSLLNYDPPK